MNGCKNLYDWCWWRYTRAVNYAVLKAGLINQSTTYLENEFKLEKFLISLGMVFHIIGPEYERLV